MNRTQHCMTRRPRTAWIFSAALATAALPWPCFSAVQVAASADARYEYNSNVFDLQSGLPVPGTTDYQRSDNLFTYGAAVDLNYLWERQKLFLTLADNEFHYDHFTQMNHNEYNLDGGLNWKLLEDFDGIVDVQRNRAMVAFTNVNNAQFVLQTEQRDHATAGWHFMPDWRLEGTGTYRTVDQQFQDGSPELKLRETGGSGALQYIGLAGLTAGFTFGYSDGTYTGATAALNPSYEQKSYLLTGRYVATGRSAFNGSVGYSDRTSASNLNSISGFTGELDYDNQITGKTSVHAQLSRMINSYVANFSSEIDSTAAFNVRWQTTYRLGVIAGYNFTTRNLPGQGTNGSDRLDHQQYVSLNMDYEPLRWLSIKPYFNYITRRSNYEGATFDASVVGVYFAATWQNSRQPDFKLQQQNLPSYVH